MRASVKISISATLMPNLIARSVSLSLESYSPLLIAATSVKARIWSLVKFNSCKQLVTSMSLGLKSPSLRSIASPILACCYLLRSMASNKLERLSALKPESRASIVAVTRVACFWSKPSIDIIVMSVRAVRGACPETTDAIMSINLSCSQVKLDSSPARRLPWSLER